MSITSKVKSAILDALAIDNGDDSPFLTKKDGGVFLKFDEIAIFNSPDGGVRVELWFRGEKMSSLNIAGPRFENDDTLCLRGIEGHQRLEIGPS